MKVWFKKNQDNSKNFPEHSLDIQVKDYLCNIKINKQYLNNRRKQIWQLETN